MAGFTNLAQDYKSNVDNIAEDLLEVEAEYARPASALEKYANDTFSVINIDDYLEFRIKPETSEVGVQTDEIVDLTSDDDDVVEIVRPDLENNNTIAYKCPWCGILAMSYADHRRHNEIPDKGFKCCVCQKEFKKFGNGQTHMRACHTTIHCHACKKGFGTDVLMHSHFLNDRLSGDPYCCCVCGNVLDTIDSLFGHFQKLHGTDGQLWYPDAYKTRDGRNICKYCPFESSNLSECNEHNTEKYWNLEKKSGIKCCSKGCIIISKSVNLLTRHFSSKNAKVHKQNNNTWII